MGLGQLIRDLRQQRGLSAEELGRRSGLTGNFLRKLEKDERKTMSVETAAKLSKGLGVSPLVFFSGPTATADAGFGERTTAFQQLDHIAQIANGLKREIAEEGATGGFWKAVVEHLPVGILVHRRGVGIYGNKYALRLAGLEGSADLPDGSLIGNLAGVFAPEDLGRVYDRIRNPVPEPLLVGLLGPEGKTVLVKMEGITLDHEGGPVRVVLIQEVGRDLTGSEVTARLDAERLMVLAQGGSDGLLVHDEGHVLFVNEALREMFGVPELGVGWDLRRREDMMELVSPEAFQRLLKQVDLHIDKRFVIQLKKRTGEDITVSIKGRTVSYLGRPVRVVTVREAKP